MIPVRLSLQNFLSYGEVPEPLDLTGIHVACLSGPNGHGKSALLDAITWALWGKARVNTADDLVRLGATAMFVDFEFELEGRRHRVIRKRTRGRTGQSDLQLQIAAGDAWRPLTEGGVQATQERIQNLLRMDYDTFINSAFILQGRADEFARKAPAERKRILGEILNLGLYDSLEDRARQRMRDAAARARALEDEIQRLEGERAREPELAEAVREQTEAQKGVQLALAQARVEYQRMAALKMELDAQRRQRDDLQRRLSLAEQELRSLEAQAAAARDRVVAAENLLQRADEIAARVRELDAVRAQLEIERDKLRQLRALEQRRAEAERAQAQDRSRLAADLAVARQRVCELLARQEQIPNLEAEERSLREQIEALERLEQEQRERAERKTALIEVLAGQRPRRAQMEQQRAEAHERFELLKKAGARCPLCESDLPEERRKTLGWNCRHERDALDQQLKQLAGEQARQERALRDLERELTASDQKLRTGQQWRHRLAQAQQKLLDLRKAAEELPPERDRADQLEARRTRFDEEAAAALQAIDAGMRAVAYDENVITALGKRERELAGAPAEQAQLEMAERRLPEERAHLEDLERLVGERRAALPEDRATLAELDRALTRAPAVEAELRDAEAQVAQLEAAEMQSTRELAATEAELARCRSLADTVRTRRAERDAASREEACYRELARAFGKNGIQTLIIENAIPDIEQEANALLARMTENEMRVAFQLQRPKKDRGMAETLDIRISDGAGERKYELFSGGEAFRINFAVRIALSKLLARRAGARLQTLVIDEGFGSQDTEGRQRLVEAIDAVKDDFERILVITHLDELKEAFPVRIEVTKTAAGSQFAIL